MYVPLENKITKPNHVPADDFTFLTLLRPKQKEHNPKSIGLLYNLTPSLVDSTTEVKLLLSAYYYRKKESNF